MRRLVHGAARVGEVVVKAAVLFPLAIGLWFLFLAVELAGRRPFTTAARLVHRTGRTVARVAVAVVAAALVVVSIAWAGPTAPVLVVDAVVVVLLGLGTEIVLLAETAVPDRARAAPPEEPTTDEPPTTAPAPTRPRAVRAPFLLPVDVPAEAQRCLDVWQRYVRQDPPAYRDSVVGMWHDIDRDLPADALACLRRGRPGPDIDERYMEPMSALHDGDLDLPRDVADAYLTIHDLYREFGDLYSARSRPAPPP